MRLVLSLPIRQADTGYHSVRPQNERFCFCTIQVITDTHAFHVQFPYDDLGEDDDQVRISNNRLGKSGLSLDIHTPEFHAAGSVHFGSFTPIKYDIMGPFQYIPFMQCRHSVYSMHHRVDGEIRINGVPYIFQNAVGYAEGDRGCSFPKEYAWTQCSFPDGVLLLSVADIPLGRFHFTGVIGVVLLHGKRIPHCHLSGRQGSENQRWRNRRPSRPLMSNCETTGFTGASAPSTCGRRHDTDDP